MNEDALFNKVDDGMDMTVSFASVLRLNLSDVPKVKKVLTDLETEGVRTVYIRVYPGFLKIVPAPYVDSEG